LSNTNEPALIALHGARGSGKDTAYHFIEEWCAKSDPALSAVRRGFADKMKWAYMRMWVPDCTMEWAINFIEQYKNDPTAFCSGYHSQPSREPGVMDYQGNFIYPVNFRDHMNQFATESARHVYGYDHWLDLLLPQQDDRHVEGWRESFMIPPKTPDDHPYSIADVCVINDLRADNELERVRDLGGLLVKVRRRSAEKEQATYYAKLGIPVHEFARELPDELFHVTLGNNFSLGDLRRNVFAMMHEVDYNGIESIKRGLPLPWPIGY
jgi:hypothetical protein